MEACRRTSCLVKTGIWSFVKQGTQHNKTCEKSRYTDICAILHETYRKGVTTMFYPNPFDFNGDGGLDFGERAFRDEFLTGGFDADNDDEDEDYDEDEDDEDDDYEDDEDDEEDDDDDEYDQNDFDEYDEDSDWD